MHPGDQEENDAKLTDLINDVLLLSKVSHPCLVKMLGASIDAAQPMLVTEFLENQDVESLVYNCVGQRSSEPR